MSKQECDCVIHGNDVPLMTTKDMDYWDQGGPAARPGSEFT